MSQPEPIRLVIWDLDRTFWDGTLSEEGIAWRDDHAEIVRTLSRRGIVNSICSKNDAAEVSAVLHRHGMAEYFVFPSVSWDAKGPRLHALVGAVQLRPATILFIDDNPMNLAEAAHYVPGLQVADETILPRLLLDPRLAGKPDPKMSRLEQYRMLEQRHADLHGAGGDTDSFLRESGITVEIEHDLGLHEDRAIELINRTNQLNFTKKRLPEDQEDARGALRQLLDGHNIQAGILRVRDRYGDHGYCGLYVQATDQSNPRPYLLHFAFSCRILGMGVETWLYRWLNRPILRVQGEVLTDIAGDPRDIDWIRTVLPGVTRPEDDADRPLAYVMGRGGCDMRALLHYFAGVAHQVVDEAAPTRNGRVQLTCSSLLAVHAIDGAPASLIADCAPLGYLPEDFGTVIAAPPRDGPSAWLLNFHFEQPVPVLRHKATGLLVHGDIPNVRGPALRALFKGVDPDQADAALCAHLRRCFDHVGAMPDDVYRATLARILAQAPATTLVFILLANERGRNQDGTPRILDQRRDRNAATSEVAAHFPDVELLPPELFMSAEELDGLHAPSHYGRLAYYRMFRHVMRRVAERREPASVA